MVTPADAVLCSSVTRGREREERDTEAGGEETVADWEEAGLEARGPFCVCPEL